MRVRISSLALLIVAALLPACGGELPRRPAVLLERERPPGFVADRHPECIGSTTLGPLVVLGCKEHCLPPTELPVVCTDEGAYLYLPVSAPVPVYTAQRDTTNPDCKDGWAIVEVTTSHRFGDREYSWAAFPPLGQPCQIGYPTDYGWFGRHYEKYKYLRFNPVTPSEL